MLHACDNLCQNILHNSVKGYSETSEEQTLLGAGILSAVERLSSSWRLS